MASQTIPPGLELVRDFVNTFEYDTADTPPPENEQFRAPEQLREWFSARGLIATGEPVTEADRRRAIEVREALRALLLANNGEPLDRDTVAVLNRAAEPSHLLVRFQGDGASDLAPVGAGVEAAIGRILANVVQATADGTWSRLKACSAHTCKWAFYDKSRNHSGKWCDMAVCGNRAKARSYRTRHKAET
jgi:predicted RNA-binding Zn ribbon-like protein